MRLQVVGLTCAVGLAPHWRLDPGLHHISWISRLAGTCFSHGDDRSVRCKRARLNSYFKPLLVSHPLLPLAKVSHRAKPNIHNVRNGLYCYLGETAKSHGKVHKKREGEGLKTKGWQLVTKDQPLTLFWHSSQNPTELRMKETVFKKRCLVLLLWKTKFLISNMYEAMLRRIMSSTLKKNHHPLLS